MSPERERLEAVRERVREALKTPCAHASHAPMLREMLDQLEQAEQREKGLEALVIAAGVTLDTDGDELGGVYGLARARMADIAALRDGLRKHHDPLVDVVAAWSADDCPICCEALAAQSKESEDSRA